jgi:hypothetical protein
MVTGRMILGAAFVLAFAPRPAAGDPDPQGAQQLMQSCDAHKFETVVNAVVDGQPHQSKVKLCGKEGQSDAEWIGTLKDAVAKLDSNADMDAAVRNQIVTAIKAEIARLQLQPAQTGAEKALALRPQPAPPTVALKDEYSSLPPLPSAPPPPPNVLGSGALLASNGPEIAKGHRAEREPEEALPLAAGPAPNLTFTCYSPDDLAGDAPCTDFQRETTLVIHAGEKLPAGLSLQFLRNGEQRATVQLAQLPQGKSLRVPLPTQVCQGVSDGGLQLQLVENGALLKSEGPYSLRC